MPGAAPPQVLQDLAFLGAACVSMDLAFRPQMGSSYADTGDSIVQRLEEIEQYLTGTSPARVDQPPL